MSKNTKLLIAVALGGAVGVGAYLLIRRSKVPMSKVVPSTSRSSSLIVMPPPGYEASQPTRSL